MKWHFTLLAFLLFPVSFLVAQTNNSGEVSTAGIRIANATQTNGEVEVSSNIPEQAVENQTNETETATVTVSPSDCSGETVQKPQANILRKCQTDKSWLWASLISMVGAIISAFGAAFLTNWLITSRERKNYQIVGRAIVQAFKEEVSEGKKIIQSKRISNNLKLINCSQLMPTAMWHSYGSRLSEGVLSEIVQLGSCKKGTGFPPKEFPLHLARYFYYICPNVDALSNGESEEAKSLIELELSKYMEATDGILAMLVNIEKQICAPNGFLSLIKRFYLRTFLGAK